MTYHPELGHDTSTGPVSVFVLAEDALAAEGLRSALASDARIALAERAEDAAVVLWDFGASADRASLAAVSSARARKQAIVALVPDEQAAATALHQGALGVLARRIHAPTLTAAIMAVRFGL
ncbi:MAG TPA: hypothetical protein VHZ95_01190, partial [Polyangiales bacterium]|nr:hypothetical protein [Polyangiales bacterium]